MLQPPACSSPNKLLLARARDPFCSISPRRPPRRPRVQPLKCGRNHPRSPEAHRSIPLPHAPRKEKVPAAPPCPHALGSRLAHERAAPAAHVPSAAPPALTREPSSPMPSARSSGRRLAHALGSRLSLRPAHALGSLQWAPRSRAAQTCPHKGAPPPARCPSFSRRVVPQGSKQASASPLQLRVVVIRGGGLCWSRSPAASA